MGLYPGSNKSTLKNDRAFSIEYEGTKYIVPSNSLDVRGVPAGGTLASFAITASSVSASKLVKSEATASNTGSFFSVKVPSGQNYYFAFYSSSLETFPTYSFSPERQYILNQLGSSYFVNTNSFSSDDVASDARLYEAESMKSLIHLIFLLHLVVIYLLHI